MLQTLLSRLHNVKKMSSGYMARCPAHDDRKNSLKITLAEDGKILLKCHAGCDTSKILQCVDMSFTDLFPSMPLPKAPARATPPPTVQAAPSPAPGRGHAAVEKVYPYQDEQGTLLYEVVRTAPKGFYQRRPLPQGGYENGLGDVRRVLYRLPQVLEAVRQGRIILLCEGEKDADAAQALDASLCATTAPMGAGKWREEYTQALAGGRVVLCPDNDAVGRRHMETVGKLLLEAGCSVALADVTCLLPALRERKGADLSDYLRGVSDPAAALGALINQAAPFFEYDFDSVAGYVQHDFMEELLRNRNAPPLRTGFASLDRQLGGRLYDGLYVVGSVSSLGKSAFVAQIAQNIAAQGQQVLFFSLEMSRAEMTARCLTNLLFASDPMRYADLTVGKILYGGLSAEEMEAVQGLARSSALANLCFIEGNFDLDVAAVRDRVHRHKLATGRAPVVFIDYLQILRSPDSRLSDKQAMDANVIELKRISRDEGIPLFAVSSFNRQNYAAEASFAAFKESGAIEYSADVVLALQAEGVTAMGDAVESDRQMAGYAREISRRIHHTKLRLPRSLEVVTLKNRRGMAFDCFSVSFYPKTSFFCEVPAAESLRTEKRG